LHQVLKPFPTLLIVSSLAVGTAAAEETDWSYCNVPARELPAPDVQIDYRSLPIEFYADWVQFIARQKAILEGDVLFAQDERTLRADRMTYSQAEQRLEATGGIEFNDPAATIRGERATVHTDTELGEFVDAEYRIWAAHARGTAQSIERTGPQVTELSQATFTTCDPGNDDWLFKMKHLKLDQAKGEGVATGTTLRLGGVPVFYFPKISFPIDDRRRSGWLLPSFGSSEANGVHFGVPYYWNIAPNYDATFTPNIFTERGFRIDSEFRYLTRSSNGELNLQWMPDDRQLDRERYAAAIDHQTLLGRHWSADVIASDVSDDEYLEDFGNSLSLSSITYLERRGDLSYGAGPWAFRTRVQGFQTIDPTIAPEDRPYQRLPQLLLTARKARLGAGVNLDLRTELVQFEREDSVTGQRVDLFPSLTWAGEADYGFLRPSLGYRYTAYDLQGTAPGEPDRPTRELPIASLDSGLIFERDTRRGFMQTLEPRLFLAYIPFRDQNDLPVFDTSELNFGRDFLFHPNRYTGPDRVGDTQQATLALSSRLYDPASGARMVQATIGQIYYFADREVTLPGQEPQTSNRSDFLAQIETQITDRWMAGGDLFWNPDTELFDRFTFDIRYRRDRKRIANLSYRFLRDDVKHVDGSLFWPIAGRWRGIGRWLYSLQDNRTQEALLGAEYESCCWRLQVVARDYITSDVDSNFGVYVQLWLKGLTGLGNRPGDLLQRGILGYED
jgi:LPS-assembly protein